ncbi:MAG TPA: FtsX-like permease family protein [Granulicella sp.]
MANNSASSLSWRLALKIAAREMRSSKGKFFFVVLSVAIGVAALTGVRGFSATFRSALLAQARSIMAADLSTRMFAQPTDKEQAGLDAIAREGVTITPVTELLSMASAAKTMEPLLVSLKAVDPRQYPFYGTIDLQPAGQLKDALTPQTVVVADDLLARLKLNVGDELKIGTQTFRIAAVVTNEPDRLSGSFASGPRVFLTQEGLKQSGLIGPGSHAGQRFLFKVPPPRQGAPLSEAWVAQLKAQLEDLLPEAQVSDYRETSPALSQGLDRATSVLSLMSLVALVLGAVGVAMAMRAHLQQRMDTIAIMKSLGAGSGAILRIYVLQTLLLGVLGGVIGVALGVAVQGVFPVFLERLLHVQTSFQFHLSAIAVGLGAGVLTTLLFTLPPLLDIRGIRPILILRRAVEDQEDASFGAGILRRLKKNRAQIAAAVLILVGLAVLATLLSDSLRVGQVFSLGLVVVLIVLMGASTLLLSLLRRLLERTRLSLPSSLRHGLANLYRPGNPTAPLLAALGLGVMQIMTVYLVQQAVVQELHVSTGPSLPNVFLVDMTDDEVGGVKKLLELQPQVKAEVELLPVISSRILSVDGMDAESLKLKNFPRRLLRSVSLTWRDTVPPGTTVTAGQWWKADETRPEVAVSERQAERLGVKLGSQIAFAAQDREFTATVTALTKSDGQHAFSRADFVFPHAALRGMPLVWYGGVHVDPAQVDKVQRVLYAAYPSVSTINVAQALEAVRLVVMQITYVIQFLAAFSIFAGAVILASSIAGTRYRRIREVVVLKTLGATRGRIATIFSIEFAVLGLVAGLVGAVFANAVTAAVLHQLTIEYRVEWLWAVVALAGSAALTVATGWLASFRVLGQKPLEVLREE